MIPPRYGLAAVLMLNASLHAGALEVVTNPSIKENTLSITSIRSIFSMRMTQWPDGTPIRVFVLGDKDPSHTEFSKQVLGVFPHQLRRAWNRQIYSGTGQAPNKVDTEAEMRHQIETTPGAIGYLPEDQLNEHIRRIEIE
jgi:ABC-type phosphate transport system substrate-binding protein